MTGKFNYPKYAVRLFVLIVFSGILFFGGLQLFVPEGSKLTGSYDAESLLYIAAAPVAYRGSASCGAANCHSALFKQWSEGAHGARQEQSKCEVCHGPQGEHPEKIKKLTKVTGDGNLIELCLSCHRQMKARSTTGQPQISPQQHPYPHEGVLSCLKCHNPHSPGIKSAAKLVDATTATTTKTKSDGPDDGSSIANSCFSCHGPSGRGGFAPLLAGQSYKTLKEKLIKFRSGELKGTMMNPIVSKMKDKEIDALAKYFSGVK